MGKKSKRKSRATKSDRKPKIGHTPEVTAAYKEKFLDKLERGIMPLYAAKVCGISKATIYNWRRDDTKFATDQIGPRHVAQHDERYGRKAVPENPSLGWPQR